MTDMERVMQGVIPYLSVDGADKVIAFYEKGVWRERPGHHAKRRRQACDA